MEIFDRNYKLFYLVIVFLSLFLTHESFTSQSQNEKFELKDINQIKDIGSLDVSKDAQLITYTVSSVDQKNDEYDTDIWMLDFKKDRDKLIVRSAYSPKFSPNSNYVAYLAPGRGKYSDYHQLWFFNTKTATKRPQFRKSCSKGRPTRLTHEIWDDFGGISLRFPYYLRIT